MDTQITSSMADHDILSAIRWNLNRSNITWVTQHVHSNQDEGDTPTVLTQFESFNCEMDEVAKQVLQGFGGVMQMPLMEGTLWSISIGQDRIVKHMDQRIYDHVHGREVQKYWQCKGKLGEDPDKINWKAINLVCVG